MQQICTPIYGNYEPIYGKMSLFMEIVSLFMKIMSLVILSCDKYEYGHSCDSMPRYYYSGEVVEEHKCIFLLNLVVIKVVFHNEMVFTLQ